MASFFRSPFKSTPAKTPPVFVPGHKVQSTKTVNQVLGTSFDYEGSVSANRAFCKKTLIWCIREFSEENVLFLLMCEKYQKTSNWALFDHIYTEFVKPGVPREINFPNAVEGPITAVWNAGGPHAPVVIFDNAIVQAKMNVKDSVIRLGLASFETAFTLTDRDKKQRFDNAMAYLRSHQIHLL